MRSDRGRPRPRGEEKVCLHVLTRLLVTGCEEYNRSSSMHFRRWGKRQAEVIFRNIRYMEILIYSVRRQCTQTTDRQFRRSQLDTTVARPWRFLCLVRATQRAEPTSPKMPAATFVWRIRAPTWCFYSPFAVISLHHIRYIDTAV